MALKGKGTKIRWAVLEAGSLLRPAVLAEIGGVQTSEWRGAQEFNTTDVGGDYESTDDAAPTWQDDDTIKSQSWGFTLTARKKTSPSNITALNDLYDAWAQGKQIWIERLIPGGTDWKGGRAWITDPTEPVPWDGEITMTAGFRGQGAPVETAVTP